MRLILAIGGAVVKTAWHELKVVIESDMVEMLIHNGGSLFHDFQRATMDCADHSFPLMDLLRTPGLNKETSLLIESWLGLTVAAPAGSATAICEKRGIPVLLFTGLGCDFWQMFIESWPFLAKRCQDWFSELVDRFRSPFHYVCMGSAVIHPEVFIKAVAMSGARDFKADAVDFLDAYRPRTRIAPYGEYHKTTHKEYLEWLISRPKRSK